MEKTHYLPEDVMILILSKLPIKSLIKFKSVSRNWLALITSSDVLIQSSLDHQNTRNPLILFGSMISIFSGSSRRRQGDTWIITPESTVRYFDQTHILPRLNLKPHQWGKISIVGSCNGLICLSLPKHNTTSLVLLNPATRELRNIPELSTPKHEIWPPKYVNVSLGFDPISKVYKLVVFLGFYDLDEETKEIYVLEKSGANSSWRRLDNTPKELIVHRGPIILIDGTLYLLVFDTSSRGGYPYRVLSFDLHKEEFRKLPTPPRNMLPEHLSKWRGSLVTLVDHEFWVLKNNNNNNNVPGEVVWTRLFKLAPIFSSTRFRLVGVWKDHLVVHRQEGYFKLLLYQNYHLHQNPNLCDDLDLSDEKLKQLFASGGRLDRTYDYVESLVSVY